MTCSGRPSCPGSRARSRSRRPSPTLTLRYDQEYLTFHFAALHFSDPAQNRYRCPPRRLRRRLARRRHTREATYTNLDPGHYTFRVQAANPDGVWSEPGASLGVVRAPPWWRTIWAPLALRPWRAWRSSAASAGRRRGCCARSASAPSAARPSCAPRRPRPRPSGSAPRRPPKAENRRAAAEIESAREVHEANAKLEAANTRLETSLVELRATQTQLVQSEKLASLGQLTAGIAHEIKNPLNFVNNFADLSVDLAAELRQDLDARRRPARRRGPAGPRGPARRPPRQRRAASTSTGSGPTASSARCCSTAAAAPVERARVDVNRFVEEYANLAYHGARANDSDFNVTSRATSTPTRARPRSCRRSSAACSSTCSRTLSTPSRERRTARRGGLHGHRDGPHAPRDRRGGRPVDRGVADNGPGIPDAVLQRIFEPFFTTKPAGEGTGLGLSLAHDIVAQVHGGTMAVESAVGEGTDFTIRIPAAAPGVTAPRATA